MSRPAVHYLHADGLVVIVPGRVAALLNRDGNLTEFRLAIRGRDAELDEVLTALHVSELAWRNSATGTPHAATPERETRSEWLTTTAAAIQLHMTDRGVRTAITSGRLQAEQVDGRWRVSREALAHFKRR